MTTRLLLIARSRAFVTLLVASTLASCQNPLPTLVPQATGPSSNPSATLVPPTFAPTASALPSPLSTATNLPPTLTPLPTFQEPLAEIRRLYRNNGGCSLPCWWGITPGITSWLQVSQFFDRFSDRVIVEKAGGRQATSLPYQRFIAYYDAPDLPIDYAVSTFFHVSDGKVRWLLVDSESTRSSGFTVHTILNQLGVPDAILVTPDYYLTLWYGSIGFAASYMLDESSIADLHQLCVFDFSAILAWDPTSPLFVTQSRISVDFGISSDLEEISPMDRSAFYSAFAAKDTEPCIPLKTQ